MKRRILIVEDEALLALEIADHLIESGFEVIGPAVSTAKALKLIIDPGCDGAVLDVNLGKENAEPVALALQARGTPFIVVSGNSRVHHPTALKAAPSLSKPVQYAALISLLRQELMKS